MTSTKQKTTPLENNSKVKSKYSPEISTLKDIFPEWSEMDLMAVIEEAQGDLALAVSRITEGQAEQWDEVKSTKRKEKPKKLVEAPVRGSFKSTRGGRGGRGRGGRGGINIVYVGYTGDRSASYQPHGGEKSAALSKPNIAVDSESWENPPSDQATLANTDDWGTTAMTATEQDWSEFEKMAIKEVQKQKVGTKQKDSKIASTATKSHRPKSSNWAQIVKGPVPEPTPEPAVEKQVSPIKKTKASKQKQLDQEIEDQTSSNVPKAKASPTKSLDPSPSPNLKKNTSPGTSTTYSQYVPPLVEPPSQSPIFAVQPSQLPPGLIKKQNTRAKQENAVPISGVAGISGNGVQFGSFAAANPAEHEKISPEKPLDQHNQFVGTPSQRIDGGAPGLQAPYHPPQNTNNDYYNEHRTMGYYAQDLPVYAGNKHGQDSNGAIVSNSPHFSNSSELNNQSPHPPQPNFAYPYYPPYYMPNQFHQSHYQPMYTQPFSGKNGYAGFPAAPGTNGTSNAGANSGGTIKSSATTGVSPGLSGNSHSNSTAYPYGMHAGQHFYPQNLGYEDLDYAKNYMGQQYTAFGGSSVLNQNQKSSAEYKGQNRNRQGYNKNVNSQPAQGSNQSPPAPGAYYGNPQYQGMHYQPMMMFPHGHQQQTGYQNQRGGQGQQQGYWNGN